MNEGHDAAGSSIGAKSSFFIGTALNLNMTDEQQDSEIEKYWRKIDAGAQFIMTQPIYELAPLLRFLDRVGKSTYTNDSGLYPTSQFTACRILA